VQNAGLLMGNGLERSFKEAIITLSRYIPEFSGGTQKNHDNF
jgi:hypothetical protein